MSRYFNTGLGKRVLGISEEKPEELKPTEKPSRPVNEKKRSWKLKKPRAKPGEGFNWNLVSYTELREGTKSQSLIKVFLEMQRENPEKIFHYSEIQKRMIDLGFTDYDHSEGHRTIINLLRRLKEVERHEKGHYRIQLEPIS